MSSNTDNESGSLTNLELTNRIKELEEQVIRNRVDLQDVFELFNQMPTAIPVVVHPVQEYNDSD